MELPWWSASSRSSGQLNNLVCQCFSVLFSCTSQVAQMSSVVLHKLDALILFFPELHLKTHNHPRKHYRPCPVSGYPQAPTWPSSLPVTRKPVAKLHTARCTTSRCMKLLKADPPSRFQSNLGTSKPLEPPKHEGELQMLHRNWLIKSYEYQ